MNTGWNRHRTVLSMDGSVWPFCSDRRSILPNSQLCVTVIDQPCLGSFPYKSTWLPWISQTNPAPLYSVKSRLNMTRNLFLPYDKQLVHSPKVMHHLIVILFGSTDREKALAANYCYIEQDRCTERTTDILREPLTWQSCEDSFISAQFEWPAKQNLANMQVESTNSTLYNSHLDTIISPCSERQEDTVCFHVLSNMYAYYVPIRYIE